MKPRTKIILLRLTLFLLAIALLCICTLPIKTVTTLALPGGRIDFDGNLMTEETTTIVLTWRNYLFREDTMDPEVTFASLDTQIYTHDKPFPYFQWDGYITQSHSIYVSEWQTGASCKFYIADDQSWYLVRLNNRLFYGSVEDGPTPAEILSLTHVTKD